MTNIELAVIGGSGLYNMPDLTNVEEVEIDTPFGKPSDKLILGSLYGRRLLFLPRHGRGHILNPSEVPYRANIYALKTLGVRYVVAVSACGSLREDYAPGHVVIPDQIYDNTRKRESSFFFGGLVAHISLARPFSPELSAAVEQAVRACGGTVHNGGAFVTVEGPRFSTRAESNVYRQWGMDIIGMTTSPEAFLAAEAEMAYACMAHITDYDVWHDSEAPVTVEQVIRVLRHNTEIAQQALRYLVSHMGEWVGEFAAHSGLRDALITDRSLIPAQTKATLAPLIGRYLDQTAS
ncbi:MAG: S-methyl-5'-thioadenosine phosphorylase [Chloroflexi bacterium]|nr:S-methyl-5'-thioadenosine phosphorylase [Chloroflexota bacterium]